MERTSSIKAEKWEGDKYIQLDEIKTTVYQFFCPWNQQTGVGQACPVQEIETQHQDQKFFGYNTTTDFYTFERILKRSI